MHDIRVPKKVLNGKFHWSRLVGRSRLRRDYISRDSLLLLNISVSRRLVEDRNIWVQTTV